MEKFFSDNSFSIGNTPLVKINRMDQGLKATILGKIEGRNPSYSVKCRIGASMIWDGEKKGLLKPGMEIIEPTSGNTGIALAFVAAARGYKLNVTMPETMSMERRKVLAIFGANIILTPGAKGMKGAVEEAERIAASSPNYFMPQQFKNPANPEIHFKTTGPEIWEQTNGGIDVLVSGVGTGGTITGVSRYIKGEKKKKIISVAVEPVESPVITQRLAGKELSPDLIRFRELVLDSFRIPWTYPWWIASSRSPAKSPSNMPEDFPARKAFFPASVAGPRLPLH